MSTDFLAGISEALLNKASTSIFPEIKDKFGGTSTLTDPAATVTWGVVSAPQFSLGSSDQFALNLVLSVAVTPKGGTETSENVNASATTSVTITPAGHLGFSISDINFTVSDPFLLAVLNAKKQDIISEVEGLLTKVQIPVGPIAGVTFNGYATAVLGGVLYAGGEINGPASVNQHFNPGSGFQIALSELLVQQMVRTQWWDQTSKTFSFSGGTVNLNSYSAAVSGGKLVLNINMSGNYYWGAAHWDVRIGTVMVTMSFSIGTGNAIELTGGEVSAPFVSLHPANVGAWLASIALGPVIATIDLVINAKLPGEIKSKLNRTVYTIPTLSEGFDGVNINVTPTGLSIAGSGSQILVSGDANITTIIIAS